LNRQLIVQSWPGMGLSIDADGLLRVLNVLILVAFGAGFLARA
jgi:hypothetical protein